MFTKQQVKDAWAVRRVKGEKAGFKLALEIANTSLFDETTWGGGDYILHPLTVAFNNTDSITKRIIAVLHDVVEDTDWTLDDLREMGFSERVLIGVDAVTSRDDEPYFDFVVRCGQSGVDAIDVKLKDLDHNTKKNRAKAIDPKPFHVLKEKAYNISYFYLVAIKKGEIEPGTPIMDFIRQQPEYTAAPAVVNQLMGTFSSETQRLPVPPPAQPAA